MSIQIKRDQSLAMRHIVHVRNHIISVDGAVEEAALTPAPIRMTCTTLRSAPARR